MHTAQITSRTIAVEHVRIASAHPFAQVRAALEADLPQLDPSIMGLLASGDVEAVNHQDAHGPTLSIFLTREHGDLLEIVGRKRNAVQFEIGNPIIASKMTRHDLAASLYAPLRVALFETDEGETVFEYDKPSTLFGQIGNERITEVALFLDRELEAALLKAAG
jgi:uncharacterized protein (DUF302 family)